MQIEKKADGGYALHVGASELVTLNNLLNEVCNGIDVAEFSTRPGASRGEVKLMLQRVGSALAGADVG